MRSLFLAIFFLTHSALAGSIVGEWKYIAYQYEGHTWPSTPGLDLRFFFYDNGTTRLHWRYDSEDGFCESKSVYEIRDDEWLFQRITWVNPDNHLSCAKDSDMQLGRESLTHYRIEDNKLKLDLDLNGNPFTYILEGIAP